MRVNDKVLIENINDYFTHKGLSPNLIDDIKGKLKRVKEIRSTRFGLYRIQKEITS